MCTKERGAKRWMDLFLYALDALFVMDVCLYLLIVDCVD